MRPRAIVMVVLLAWLVILGLATGFSLFYRLGYIIAIGLCVGYLWNYLNLWRVSMAVERRTRVAYTGGAFVVRIWATNGSFFNKSRIDIRDCSTLTDTSYITPIVLNSRQTRSWLVDISCTRRGSYTLGPLEVHSEDLFGFFYQTKLLETQQEIVVYPRIIELPSLISPVTQVFDDGVRSKKTQSSTPQAMSIRQYESGDTVNRIHWPMTAKHGELMSKEFDANFSTESWIVLDLQSFVHSTDGPRSTDEPAVTVAVSLAKRLMHLGTSVGILSQSTTAKEIPLGRGQQHLIRILDILAHSQADGIIPLSNLLELNQHKFGKGCVVTIITPSLLRDSFKILQYLNSKQITIAIVQIGMHPLGEPVSEPLFKDTISTIYINPENDLDSSLQFLYSPWSSTSSQTPNIRHGVK
jgi:uncharacterized protein (DUF58 family)